MMISIVLTREHNFCKSDSIFCDVLFFSLFYTKVEVLD